MLSNYGKFFVGIASVSILTGSQLCAYNYANEYDYDEKEQFQETDWHTNNTTQALQQTPAPVAKPRVSYFNRSRHYQNPQNYPVDQSSYYSTPHEAQYYSPYNGYSQDN